MTDGDDTSAAESLAARIEDASEELDAAETEADLDGVETTIDEIETELEEAELPEPEDDDEDGPQAELESDLSALRDGLEEQRGPYADEAVETVESARSDIEGTRWTDSGEGDVVAAVEAFLDAVEDVLGERLDDGEDLDALVNALGRAIDAIESEELHPDSDADEIAALIDASDELDDGLDAAEEWSDLTVRQQLQVEGFYDVLDHHKDYPPEWSALKVWEKRARVDMILLGLETFDSDFMERHCLEALERLGDEESLDAMLDRAQKRDQDAIRIIGNIGSEEPVETLLDYVEPGSDDKLQRVTMTALGKIGTGEAVQPIANRLLDDHEDVRSQAARALGLIGDTRAIEPLADVLENDDSDTVRASAAWALNRIGTADALDVAREYADDRAYLVQNEAEKAADAADTAGAA